MRRRPLPQLRKAVNPEEFTVVQRREQKTERNKLKAKRREKLLRLKTKAKNTRKPQLDKKGF